MCKCNIYYNIYITEKRYENLPKNASQKAKDELDGICKNHKKYLLQLQEQKDLYQTKIKLILKDTQK